MLSIIEPTSRVDGTGKMLIIIIVSIVFNIFIGIEASCEIPISPEHGTLHLLGDSKVDSLALYSCDKGWKLVGSTASKCLITGKWTSLPPKCVAEKRSSSFTTATAIVPKADNVVAALPEPKATSVEKEERDTAKPSKQTTHDNNCSCIYNSHDRKLSADVNGLGLWNGDKVRKGDKMILRCYDQTKSLVLPNATIISGTLELTCDICRVWEDSDLPSCQNIRSEKKCVVLQKPEHGTMEFIGSAANPVTGTIALFVCDGDRIPNGPISSKCLSTGEWTFPAPSCIEPCSIPFVQNGRIGKWVSQSHRRIPKYEALPVGQRIEDGDKFFLHCDNGYRPLGIPTNWQAQITCRGGDWSDDPFCELSTCQAEPPEAENGRVEKMDRKHDGTVSYECLPNFSKAKTGSVKCDMGEWKGMPPTCKDVRCHAEGVRHRTGVAELSNVTLHGDVLQVHCREGYEPRPNLQHCWNGEWRNNQESPCKQIRCHTEGVRHRTGVAEISNVTLHGDVLQVHCREGYEPRPNLQHCWNGEWRNNQESPCKQKDCTVPWISNGHIEEKILGPLYYNFWRMVWQRNVTYNTQGVGSVPSRDANLFLVCQNGYSIQGTRSSPGNIACLEGRWSPDLVCLRNGTRYRKTTEAPRSVTRTLVTPASTTSSSKSTTMREALRFVSRTVGTKSTTTTGTPVASRAPAEANHEERYVPPDNGVCYCEYLPDGNFVAHADGKEVKMNDKVKNGTVLKLRCEKVGFHRLFGPTEVLCDNCRPWSSSDFPSCRNPTRGDTIIVYGTINVSPDGVLEPRKGQSLRLSCSAMETRGFPEWRFPNVTGIDVTEERRERTGDILYLSHLDIKNITSKYNGYYSCAFAKENPTTVQLQVVAVTCPQLEKTEGITVKYSDGRRVYSTATFSCAAPFVLYGPPTLQCQQTGVWDRIQPTCRKPEVRCPPIRETDVFSVQFINDRKINSTALFRCKDANLKIVGGLDTRTCQQSGEWSGANPDCEAPGCLIGDFAETAPRNLLPSMEGVTEDLQPVGSELTMYCEKGYVLIEKKKATCGPLGKWNFGNAQCVSGCQLNIEDKSSALQIKPYNNYYRIGQSFIVSCSEGFELTSDVERVMCMTNGWSDTIPNCKKETNK